MDGDIVDKEKGNDKKNFRIYTNVQGFTNLGMANSQREMGSKE